MSGKLTTHVLDTMAGTGAGGMAVWLLDADGTELTAIVLDDAGRGTLVAEGLEPGRYALCFAAADYHRRRGAALDEPPFLDVVTVAFGVNGQAAHTHVPLLLSPFGYTVYRGC